MRWVPVLLWMIVIFILSTASFSEAHTTARLFSSSVSFAIRKLAHWGVYFVLGALLVRALIRPSEDVIPKGRILMAVLLAVFYAGFDEWHQSFVPSRNARTRDVLIDAIGALCGVSFYVYAMMKQNKTHKASPVPNKNQDNPR